MAVEGTPRRRRLTELERREAIARLALRNTQLDHEEVLVFREIYPDVYRLQIPQIWKRLERRGIPEHDAKDVMQNIQLAIFRRVCERGFGESMTAVTHSIVGDCILNYVRARKRNRCTAGVPSSGSAPPATGPGVDSAAYYKEVVAKVVSQISDDHWVVIELLILNGLEQTQAAEILGIPVRTLRARLAAAKARLIELAQAILDSSPRPQG